MPISQTSFEDRLSRIARRTAHEHPNAARHGLRGRAVLRLGLRLVALGFGAKVGAMMALGSDRFAARARDLLALLPPQGEALGALLLPDPASLWIAAQIHALP